MRPMFSPLSGNELLNGGEKKLRLETNLQNSTSDVLELIRLKVKLARCPEVLKVLSIKIVSCVDYLDFLGLLGG